MTSSSSSSSSSSPSLLPNSLPPQSSTSSSSYSSSLRTAPWMVTAMTGRLSQSLDASASSEAHKRGGKPRCHPSPHPRKHSLDFHLRPVEIPLTDDGHFAIHPSTRSLTTSGYQVPRPASTPQPRPPRRPSSTPSVDSLTQAELLASTPTPPPPPRPPKPTNIATSQGEGPVVVPLPQSLSEPERKDKCADGGVPRCHTFTPGRPHAGKRRAVAVVDCPSQKKGSRKTWPCLFLRNVSRYQGIFSLCSLVWASLANLLELS